MMSTSGLMVISQFATFAADFGIAQAMVFGMAALPLALTDRPLHQRPDAAVLRLGVRSDRPREHDVPGLRAGSCGDAAVAGHARRPAAVRRCCPGSCSSAGARSSRCFPSTLTDTFGTRNATRNYGCLYIAQGIGAIFGGPLASLLHAATGNWVACSLWRSRPI